MRRRRDVRVAGGLQDLGEVEPRCRSQLEVVGLDRDLHCLASKRFGLLEVASCGPHLRPHRAPRGLVEAVVPRPELLADDAELLGLVDLPLPVDRLAQSGRATREEASLAHPFQQLVRLS